VLALGRPTGEGIQASLGVVSAVSGPVHTRHGGLLEGHIRTDAIPYPGFSGGPLVDGSGQVLGMNTSGLTRGSSIAIPMKLGLKVAEALVKHGSVRRGYLGVRSQPVEIPENQQNGLGRQQNSGLLLVGVESDSPAGEAGLMVGDDKRETVFAGIEHRVNTLKMLVDSIHEPIVIFTRFTRDVEIIRKAIKEPIHSLTGYVDNHDEWRNGKGRILVANIGAGSEGVRLERARHMIFWSVGYSNTQFEQAKARIIRAGQKSKTVWLHYIVSENTIDETIYKTLAGKNEDKNRLDGLIC